ncbi:MAG: cytochrome c3 family protein [Planctomycetota bacterium]
MNAKLGVLFLMLTAGFTLPVLFGFGSINDMMFPNLHTGYQPDQPLPFSHRLHAGNLNMDCEYCHTGADESRHATIPNLSTCKNCHWGRDEGVAGKTSVSKEAISKIHDAYEKGGVVWKRVHNNADFVYFNHMTHTRIARDGEGFSCETCHGEMSEKGVAAQENNLSMGWCINCHRTWNEEYEKKEVMRNGKPIGNVAPVNACDACHR